jgi:uncharacterized RDD family membrane protein YckC
MIEKDINPEESKEELRSKFASAFKLFDDEGPTTPVEITNVGKLNFKIEDLDPKKEKEISKESVINKVSEFDEESETTPVEVTNVGRLNFKIEDLDPNKPKEEKNFVMNSKLEVEQKKEELVNSSTTKHYRVIKFFSRLTSTILDQTIIFAITYLYFLFLIKPNLKEIPYQYIEGVTYFIINDIPNLKSLVFGYLIIVFTYYTLFNLLIKSTPFNFLFGYKIYRNDSLASAIVLIFRNIIMISLNIILLFPFLFMIVSDDKQTLYDKIFKTHLLKES